MSKITEKELNNFWSFVDSICWNESEDSYTQKRSIMKRYSQIQTGKFLPICKELSRKLVEKYNSKGINLSYFGATNIVGKGRFTYDEYFDKIVNIDDFNEFVKQHGFSGCFLSVIPSQDDYFVNFEYSHGHEVEY